MGLRANGKYSGTLTGAHWMESQGGTPGLQVDIETDAGEPISHVWWVTPKTLPYFQKAMLDFGVAESDLASGSYMEHQLPAVLTGVDVSFGTVEEIYNGRARIKVNWIGRKKAPSDDRGVGFAVAGMFGGEVTPTPSVAPKVEIDDSDIPFSFGLPILLPALFAAASTFLA